ncbi:MAG: hypothetical protein JSW50_06540 [Candidatus Latescibacterota bacterium]|nr:MAG: hypothetical protein JSW50_06540 [Candidatus Latescibacterota bacterium]
MDDYLRPCENYGDRLALMTSGDLSDPELADVMRHLSECGQCRSYWKALQDDHKALTVFTRSHQKQVELVESNVIARILQPEPDRREAGRTSWWRWIMQTKSGRLLAGSTAAAIVIFILVFMQGTSGTFEAWADVIENVRNATSCRCRARELGSDRHEAIKTYSPIGFSQITYEDGEVVERYFIDFAAGTMIHAIPPLELAVSMTVGTKMIDRYVEKDPQAIFTELTALDYVDLGQRRVDGREAVGIRAEGRELVPELVENAEIEAWVDVKTKWPIRIDIRGTSADGRIAKRVRFDEFEWNIPVDEDDFQWNIPRAYDVASGIEIEMDEPHAIEGLGGFARVMDRYPPTLAYEQIRPVVWKQLGMRMLTTDVIPEMHRIRATCSFYGKLVREERQVVYFGDRVTPGDPDRVLLRWKTDQDDQYRVVYGDLRAETVNGAALLELEGR